jgi:circadian clock protein KaiB
LVLRLYVSADTSRSQEAIRNLEAIRDAALEGGTQIEVVDVNAEPQRAVEDRILATPTLCKLAPGPTRKVVGDLSDHAAALSKLGIPGRSSNA